MPTIEDALAGVQACYNDQIAFGIAAGYKGTPDGRKKFGRVHREIIELKNANNRRSIVIPRNHGKSTLESVIGPAFELVRNPGDRIMLASAERGLAMQLLGECRNVLAGELEILPGVFIDMDVLFPHAAPVFNNGRRTSGKVEEFNVVGREGTPGREPSAFVASPGSNLAGRHPRRAILDDPTNEQTSRTPAQCQKAIDFVEQLIPLMFDDASPILHIGTPWAFWDITAYLEELHGWNQVRYSVWDGPGGGPLCPSFMNREELEDTRDNKVSSEFWSMQYLCTPSVGDTALVHQRDLELHRWPDRTPMPAGMDFLLVDPVAVTDGTSGDRNGLVKVRVVPNGSLPASQQTPDASPTQNIFIFHWAEELKGNADTAVQRIEDLADSVSSIWIENVVFSGTIKPWLRDRGRIKATKIRTQKIPAIKLKQRLGGFPMAIRKGIIRFGPNGYHGQQLLESRLIQYPKAPFDDLPAAMALIGTHLERRGTLPTTNMDADRPNMRDLARVPGALEQYGANSVTGWMG